MGALSLSSLQPAATRPDPPLLHHPNRGRCTRDNGIALVPCCRLVSAQLHPVTPRHSQLAHDAQLAALPPSFLVLHLLHRGPQEPHAPKRGGLQKLHGHLGDGEERGGGPRSPATPPPRARCSRRARCCRPTASGARRTSATAPATRA